VSRRGANHVGRLRIRAAGILGRHFPGLDIRPEDIRPATGHWRTDCRADVYRWEVFCRNRQYGHPVILGCWQTLTEFVALAAKYGVEQGDLPPYDISAPPGPSKPIGESD
jgi:hypothetical protein